MLHCSNYTAVMSLRLCVGRRNWAKVSADANLASRTLPGAIPLRVNHCMSSLARYAMIWFPVRFAERSNIFVGAVSPCITSYTTAAGQERPNWAERDACAATYCEYSTPHQLSSNSFVTRGKFIVVENARFVARRAQR